MDDHRPDDDVGSPEAIAEERGEEDDTEDARESDDMGVSLSLTALSTFGLEEEEKEEDDNTRPVERPLVRRIWQLCPNRAASSAIMEGCLSPWKGVQQQQQQQPSQRHGGHRQDGDMMPMMPFGTLQNEEAFYTGQDLHGGQFCGTGSAYYSMDDDEYYGGFTLAYDDDDDAGESAFNNHDGYDNNDNGADGSGSQRGHDGNDDDNEAEGLSDPLRAVPSDREEQVIQAFCGRVLSFQTRISELQARQRACRAKRMAAVALLVKYMRDTGTTCARVTLGDEDRPEDVRCLRLIEKRSACPLTEADMQRALDLVDAAFVEQRAIALLGSGAGASTAVAVRSLSGAAGARRRTRNLPALRPHRGTGRSAEAHEMACLATALGAGRRSAPRGAPRVADLFVDVLLAAMDRSRASHYDAKVESVNEKTKGKRDRGRDHAGHPPAGKRRRVDDNQLPSDIAGLARQLHRIDQELKALGARAKRLRMAESAITEDLPTVDGDGDVVADTRVDTADEVATAASTLDEDRGASGGDDASTDCETLPSAVAMAEDHGGRPARREGGRKRGRPLRDRIEELVGVPLRAPPRTPAPKPATARAKKAESRAAAARARQDDHARFAPLRDTIGAYLRRAFPKDRTADLVLIEEQEEEGGADGDNHNGDSDADDERGGSHAWTEGKTPDRSPVGGTPVADSGLSGESVRTPGGSVRRRNALYRLDEFERVRLTTFTAAQKRATLESTLRKALAAAAEPPAASNTDNDDDDGDHDDDACRNRRPVDCASIPSTDVDPDAELTDPSQARLVCDNIQLLAAMATGLREALARHKAYGPKKRTHVIRLRRDPQARPSGRAASALTAAHTGDDRDSNVPMDHSHDKGNDCEESDGDDRALASHAEDGTVADDREDDDQPIQ